MTVLCVDPTKNYATWYMHLQYTYCIKNSSWTVFFIISSLDKPEYVQFTSNATGDKACQNNIVKFNCSADANPPVLSYQLFGNDTALEISNSGMWSKPLSSSGLFIYKCVANNTIGSESSTSISITVNGKSRIFLKF